MITDWRPIAPAVMLAALAWLCGGCSGINRSIDVSPATFLLPGLVQAPESFIGPPLPDSFIVRQSDLKVALAK